jgi:hypothetical protein
MFLRKKQNRSGSTSIQIISKARGKYEVVKTIGSGRSKQEIQKLWYLGKQEIERLTAQTKIYVSEQDTVVEQAMESLANASIRTIGPELILGKLFDHIGFSQIKEDLFRHLVIARLAFPLSKLKTTEYLYRYLGIELKVNTIYRFMDKLNDELKEKVERIAFTHTKKVLKGNLSVVFYDMTTLYFEASDEDDLRKAGFSKDGKHQNPQIYLGLLVGLGGYTIGYDIFEGDIYEGHTLIPFLENISARFDLGKPIVVADAGLLSNENLQALKTEGYKYILGARIKNESELIKRRILSEPWKDDKVISLSRKDDTRLIVAYSKKRAKKDEHNRQRGLRRLEKQIKNGKLTKSNINNRGYNKYLKLEGEVNVIIDYEKFNTDKAWDGLKGYITNTKLAKKEIIENYNNLWHIEKAFRMSKTDLRIRPIYHRIEDRIRAHICIAFSAYCVYKELERILYKEKTYISIKKAIELTHNMYQITYILPESKHAKSKLLKMDDEQMELYTIIQKNC